mmetsp:Transcript_14255/g.22204  ORF Transcript_14255/g.22204 Transcript_14255/m.22204 type:complete len:115 (+) Transcript_14255:1993-2337(+)
MFMENSSVIGFLLNSLEVRIFSPESEVLKAYDGATGDLFFIGDGHTDAYYHSDLKQKSQLIELRKGSIFNHIAAIFGFRWPISYISKSYTTIGRVKGKEMKELFQINPEIKRLM